MVGSTNSEIIGITPVLPSSEIGRDVTWYHDNVGFECVHADEMYAVLRRGSLRIHLQWHADTEDDPLLGGSVIKIFVKDIRPLFDEIVGRGSVRKDQFRSNTAWGTNEFGLYDLNNNAIFFVENI